MRLRQFNICILLLFLLSCGSRNFTHNLDVSHYRAATPVVTKVNDSTFVSGDAFLQKNQHKIWETFYNGNPLQLGYRNGALSQELMHWQEASFFSKVEQLVPSKFKQKLLRGVLNWYARKMPEHVIPEYQTELYGISCYYSDHYNFIAPKFQRSMYLHAAHDIGHAMQDLMLVGCSSMAAWGDQTEDGSLLLGRVFDFYVGDEFAKQKLIQFVRPEQGIPFMSVSWPGMIGVASGMNTEGLTVTINAGKSKIPWAAKTPISLLTREILQYATTIDEAVAIAKKRHVFVSESIMVGSAKDKKAVIIEVSPKNIGVYETENSGRLICTNHFQSETYSNDRRNLKQIKESHSEYRYEKIQTFFNENPKVNPEKIAQILRDRSGIKHESIGNGNEKSINQLMAHHAVIFLPEKRLVWVSASPYQLGEFVCYDLEKIFGDETKPHLLSDEDKNIAADPFLYSTEFQNYEKFRSASHELEGATKSKQVLPDSWISEYKTLNPDLWLTYFRTGKYYFEQKNYRQAAEDFQKSLSLEIPSIPEKESVQKYLKKVQRKIN